MTLDLATCSYRAYTPSMGLPVATSVGRPKPERWPWSPLTPLGDLAPYGIFGVAKYHDDPDAARKAYRARLHRRSAWIMRRLSDLADCYPGTPLVLLCWEADAADCHRSWLAGWLYDRHGLTAPELPRLTQPTEQEQP